MLLALRLVLTLIASVLIVNFVQTKARADERRFVHAGIAGDAKRYEANLKAQWQPTGGGHELRAEGDKLLAAGNSPRGAARAYAQAVAFDGNDVVSWIGLARAPVNCSEVEHCQRC